MDDRHHACQSLYSPESAPRRFRSEGNGKPDGRMAHPLSRRRDGRRWDSMSNNSGDEYDWLSAHGYGKPSASRVSARATAAEPSWTDDRFQDDGWHQTGSSAGRARR